MTKYIVEDEDIKVDGESIAQIELLPGDLNECRLHDLIAAANRGVTRAKLEGHSGPRRDLEASADQLVQNDLEEVSAAQFMVDHSVPFISPEIGSHLIRILGRLEVVSKVYPLSSTLEAYKLALTLAVQIASYHQQAFCIKMEEVLRD